MILRFDHPISTNALWAHVNGRRVLTRQAREWKKTTGWMAKAQGAELIKGSFQVAALLYRKPRGKLDIDNLKIVFDSLKGVAYEDDRDMEVLHIERGPRREHGGITLRIEPFSDEPGRMLEMSRESQAEANLRQAAL